MGELEKICRCTNSCPKAWFSNIYLSEVVLSRVCLVLSKTIGNSNLNSNLETQTATENGPLRWLEQRKQKWHLHDKAGAAMIRDEMRLDEMRWEEERRDENKSKNDENKIGNLNKSELEQQRKCVYKSKLKLGKQQKQQQQQQRISDLKISCLFARSFALDGFTFRHLTYVE